MLLSKGGFVYIIANKHNNVLYTGVTSNLKERVEQHIHKTFGKSFSARYNCNKLVYYCGFPYIRAAIAEEKRIKAGNRKQKIRLIESKNPEWKNLWDEINKNE